MKRYTRDALNGIVTHHTTGLMWQDNTISSKMNWKDAVNYSKNLLLGGYHDWRLPTIEELKTLVDKRKVDPAINPIFQNIASNDYWSSTTVAGEPAYAWSVYFSYGGNGWDEKVVSNYVRCVRGNKKL